MTCADGTAFTGTVDNLTTHRRFGLEPTTFAQFARHNAAMFRGDAEYRVTP
ncbi:hypothetical protein MTP10_33815 [Nonomuraea sp. 3-1Str]|uniref:hypothetical protein n=1 Tax=Nonomuraea sp. 3-1Str TaxID=2929801 RepID=UPI002857BC12|nr:hypothetical protein [Nonomuraea sp. 3-1Str]MDR8413697.1 hypothetical protein [Nonomuraea sp. 3-1Str]